MISTVTADNIYEFRGLSSDEKPTLANRNIGNGSVFFEMDTCKVFMFDRENETWVELA